MRKHIMRILLVSGIVVATAGLGAGQAFAASTISISNPNADGSFSATATTITLTDNSASFSFECVSGTAGGSIPSATKVTPPVQIGTISSTTYSDCTGGPGGIPLSVKQVGTWNINASDVVNGGITNGGISNIDVKMSGTLCKAEAKGSVVASYNNNGKLNINSSGLTVIAVSGCGAVFTDDSLTLSAIYTLAQPVTVTTP